MVANNWEDRLEVEIQPHSGIAVGGKKREQNVNDTEEGKLQTSETTSNLFRITLKGRMRVSN